MLNTRRSRPEFRGRLADYEDSRRRAYRLTELGRGVLIAESARLAALVKVAVEKAVLPAAPA